MAILTNDISKLGGCLVGDFYNVEVTTPTEEEYERQFINAYGDTRGMNPLENFESLMWKYKKDVNAIIEEIENHMMPEGPHMNEQLRHFIADVARAQFNWTQDMGTGSQVLDGVITSGVIFTSRSDGYFVIQLLRIKLIPR